MKEKDKPKLNVLPPLGPCDKCIETEGKIFQDVLVVCYCKHHSAGGVYTISSKSWQVFNPISHKDFAEMINSAILSAKVLQNFADRNKKEAKSEEGEFIDPDRFN